MILAIACQTISSSNKKKGSSRCCGDGRRTDFFCWRWRCVHFLVAVVTREVLEEEDDVTVASLVGSGDV